MERSFLNEMSGPEEQVSDYLTRLGLKWVYQSPVFLYDDRGRPRVWTPDFYLPELSIYIEVCGTLQLRLQKENVQQERVPRGLHSLLQGKGQMEKLLGQEN